MVIGQHGNRKICRRKAELRRWSRAAHFEALLSFAGDDCRNEDAVIY